MNDFAYRLGISIELSSYDINSTNGSDMLTMAPCPVFTQLATTSMTEACRGCTPSVEQMRRPRRADNLVLTNYHLRLLAYRLSTLRLQCCLFRDDYTRSVLVKILEKRFLFGRMREPNS